ncbi:MAG: hypothetical protein MPK06_08060 [Alphaproteobacteria bacterium]|nr:hypothetical protein [Alphaproteobacteria bacterium]MDA7984825.1 hypothetical protein [Alphaproteobacteria bacterium]MDA7989034.1 hypothetical protein [Alphaproteobacteria bacterium]MDA8004641.1 hypothetical protein [Alphaproteobacteria bacterium]MDA8006463.1 hypothetical protein [Alphaproteobacteria bacterium]
MLRMTLVVLLALTAWLLLWGQRSFENALVPLGQVWYAVSPGTLNGAQAGIERYVSEGLWTLIFGMLQAPAALVTLGLSGLLVLILLRG